MAVLKGRNNYDAYKNTEISTANQSKLIVMLYDGAIRFLRSATENMEPRSYDRVNNSIVKAQDIITELMISLNLDQGGEIASNLLNLYAYMKKRLLEGNIQKDAAILKEVIGLLEELRSSWDEISQKEVAVVPAAPRTREEGIGFSIRG